VTVKSKPPLQGRLEEARQCLYIAHYNLAAELEHVGCVLGSSVSSLVTSSGLMNRPPWCCLLPWCCSGFIDAAAHLNAALECVQAYNPGNELWIANITAALRQVRGWGVSVGCIEAVPFHWFAPRACCHHAWDVFPWVSLSVWVPRCPAKPLPCVATFVGARRPRPTCPGCCRPAGSSVWRWRSSGSSDGIAGSGPELPCTPGGQVQGLGFRGFGDWVSGFGDCGQDLL
jgi:hypothetical protein